VELGTNFFSFTAADKDGTSDPVQMSVKVYSAAASNEFTQWIEDQEQDPSDPALRRRRMPMPMASATTTSFWRIPTRTTPAINWN
jgi:hypothetical protein